MISNAPDRKRLWGLSVAELHDAYWESVGVAVVRPGGGDSVPPDANRFLLLGDHALVLAVELRAMMPRRGSRVVRLIHAQDTGRREFARHDNGRFVTFQRYYGACHVTTARAVLTRDRRLAREWSGPDSTGHAEESTVDARVFHGDEPEQQTGAALAILEAWDRSVSGLDRVDERLFEIRVDDPAIAFVHESSRLPRSTPAVGKIWIGANRRVDERAPLVGPMILWDDDDTGADVEPSRVRIPQGTWWTDRPRSKAKRWRVAGGYPGKRVFDLIVAAVMLIVFLPVMLLVALAIRIEDDGPVFFGHRREGLGGREFNCFKFRTMYKNAEEIKRRLSDLNQADGPQFYIEDDPRITRIGRFLRRTHLDELPQLFNVLVGDMSVVGPRPSPYNENQYAPAWREARLSVRPGIAGLYQLRKTRELGLDFQEWIRYDIEYTQRVSFWFDLWIIARTAGEVARDILRTGR